MARARARIVLVACIVLGVVFVATAAAQAQVKRSIVPSGTNLRFQIGGELQIPIQTGEPISCVPKGGVKGVNPKKGQHVSTWPTGRVRIPTSAFTLRGPNSTRNMGVPYVGQSIGVQTQNPIALQVYTNFMIQIPNPAMTATWNQTDMGIYVHKVGAPFARVRRPTPLMSGGGATLGMGMSGRTGADVISFCAGDTMTVVTGMNPGCKALIGGGPVKMHGCGTSMNCPSAGYVFKIIPGFMRYTRTGNMLGGPGNGTLQGPANLWIKAGAGTPLMSMSPPVARIDLTVMADPALGGSFGNIFQQNAGKGPQFTKGMYNPCGIITSVGMQGVAKLLSNKTSASFGGPLTQGMLTVAAATATGAGAGGESYMITGYDNRGMTPLGNKGAGKLQLVTGSLSLRSLTGANANHGILRFEVPEPATAAGAAAALLVLAACHRLVNRRR